ncbi:expressed unknown protein [Seminavis robusta]|uniref:Uncharacterized protein n=1 Tax=Seminavis robusta TaxID=568900 RepID=A0A9N8EJV2_9STRA|nr:expressed unknown protein [Seminavis robusta]|eukprot:Sro1366_g266660.1 n/a (412) ;mRNA; f:13570-14805
MIRIQPFARLSILVLLGLASYANAEGQYSVGVSWALPETPEDGLLKDCSQLERDKLHIVVIRALQYIGIDMDHGGWAEMISEDALRDRYALWKKKYAEEFEDTDEGFEDNLDFGEKSWSDAMKEYNDLKKAVVEKKKTDLELKKEAAEKAKSQADQLQAEARKAEEEAEKALREADKAAKEATKLEREAGMSDEPDEACDTTEEFVCADGSLVTRILPGCLFEDCPISTTSDNASDPPSSSPTEIQSSSPSQAPTEDDTNDGEDKDARSLAEEQLDFLEYEVDLSTFEPWKHTGESNRRLGGHCDDAAAYCKRGMTYYCNYCCKCSGRRRRRRGLRQQQEREMMKIYSGEDIEMTTKLAWTAITAMMEKFEDDEEHNQHNRIECLKYPVEVVVKMQGEHGNIHTAGPESPV